MMPINPGLAEELARRPLKLAYNRVWRVYRGGYLIDELRRSPCPEDGHLPEDWAASDTLAINEGREYLAEGLSRVVLEGGDSVPLRDLLQAAPAAFLGQEHAASFGSRLALLVKLLDSCERLPIQAHPTRAFSRRHLNDRFGKTESWIVLATRMINGMAPYILMGFGQRLSKDTMLDLVRRQDSPGMEQALNKVPVKPGDMFIIRAGMPHAIGPGVFMVEVQEPTDWTVSAELQCGDVQLSEKLAFLGLGMDLALDVFDYAGPVGQEAVESARLSRRAGVGEHDAALIAPEDTDCFAASELLVQGDTPDPFRGRAYSGIVVQGDGEIIHASGRLELAQGDTFFVPASSRHEGYRSAAGMRVIASFPPRP
jgi:mannose-6-phosphate isomerase